MKVVIDIPENVYNEAKKWGIIFPHYDEIVALCFSDMILLPTEHGRCIDVDELVKKICEVNNANCIFELPADIKTWIETFLNNAPTILEPTKEYILRNYIFCGKENE